jgi:hypothetical protein
MSGKRYYGVNGYGGQRRSSYASDGLFGWTVFIFLLIGLVFLCWMGSYYIFAHPESPGNYNLLKRLHKIEPPQRFELTEAPRGEFLKPGKLLQRFGSMTASEIRRTNENLLRSFIRNYHQNRDLVPYAVGTYKVVGTMPLTGKDFCNSGLVAILQAVEQPEVLLEQLFTADEKNLPALQLALGKGMEIKLEKPLDLSAVIHIDRLPDNRLRLTTMPLLYGRYGAGKGSVSFSLEPPDFLDLNAGVPVLTPEQIQSLSNGKLAIPSETKKLNHLSRLPEEVQNPSPESRTAKAIDKKQQAKQHPSPLSKKDPNVARAVPVNVQPVLPAIAVGTPLQSSIPNTPNTPDSITTPPANQEAAQEIPRALPVGTPLALPPLPASTPVTTPTPTPRPTPQATATPLPAVASGAKLAPQALPVAPIASVAPVSPSSSLAVNGTNQMATIMTNQAVLPPPTEVWPVYMPGQMPRGRLVEASEANDLASRGVGGERHYLNGRFTVTASGNGRAVLRPQGGIATLTGGSSSKVRVIVDFPQGSTPPTEGNIISRDSRRPFLITSVKRGDDGLINIYVREITRGQ